MSRRRRHPPRRAARGAPEPLGHRVEQHPDGDWAVRPLTGASATKTYRCPGCDQEIRPGTPHLVVWSADGPIGAFGDVDDRRHWHTPCWAARGRRFPSR